MPRKYNISEKERLLDLEEMLDNIGAEIQNDFPELISVSQKLAVGQRELQVHLKDGME
jgi:hypothetical protein